MQCGCESATEPPSDVTEAAFLTSAALISFSVLFRHAGLCIIISVEVMRQSVKRMIASDETIWIEYYYSWSFTCACASFTLLILSGVALLLISMPHMPRNPWETCMDAEPDTLD